MDALWIGLFLAGCRCAEVERTYEDVPPVGLETRFRGESRWAPRPELAFAIRDRCPRVSSARATREAEGLQLVEVRGEGLEQVVRVGVILDDGRLADAQLVRRDDGALSFPVACADCEVLLGIASPDGRPAACTGPGRSLRFEGGRLQRAPRAATDDPPR